MIHQYINNGFHIILDVNSGAVHSVDAVMYDAVAAAKELIPDMEKPEKLSGQVTEAVISRLKDSYPEAEIAEALEEIQYLIDAG